jgi:hypothetical protein
MKELEQRVQPEIINCSQKPGESDNDQYQD